MKKILFTFVSLVFSITIFSQNLVPNAGFEQYTRRPTAMLDEGTEFTRAVPGWVSPNSASSDFITSRFRSSKVEIMPPHSGEHMIGIVVQGAHWAEYASAKLYEPLEVGKKYYVEFWISAPTKYNKIQTGTPEFNDHFGILFDKRIFKRNTKILKKSPQVFAQPGTILEPRKWKKINGTFTATEAATHLHIGQFSDQNQPDKILERYFFVDDIFVEKLEKEAEQFEPSKTYKIKGKVASIVMENIYFETDKFELLPESFSELNKLVKIMDDNPSMSINIQGHTDSDGGADYNLKLSTDRANSVKNYLIEKGISEARLTYEGHGLSKPVAENSTAQGKQKNRRVEFITKSQDTVGQGVILADLAYLFSDEVPDDLEQLAKIGKDERHFDCSNSNETEIRITPQYQKIMQSLSQYQPLDAKKFLLGKTSNFNIVNIQIAPEHPEFQMYVLEILGDLYQQGFTHIGFENFQKIDEVKNLGYPILENGGKFQHPIFGEIIRQGQLAGFDFFNLTPTEAEIKKVKTILKKQRFNFQNQTEKSAAENWAKAMNVNRILKKNPNAKVLLFSTDIAERKTGEPSTIAFWLKNFANQEVMSVGQSSTFDPCAKNQEPLHRRMKINRPSIFHKRNIMLLPLEYDQKNQSFESHDVHIYHPKNTFENNRPTYLSNGIRHPFQLNIDKHKMSYPCLVFAYKKGEDVNKAIPIDVIELSDNQDVTKLILPNGKYEIVLRDGNNRKKMDVEIRH